MKAIAGKPQTLFEFLSEQYPDSPRTRVKKLLGSGHVRVNSVFVTLNSYRLKPGDEVSVDMHAMSDKRRDFPFPVLFEDKDLIAVEKPAGISTSSIDGSASVQEILTGFIRDRTRGKQSAVVVHRLDKEVSGVLLFAKSQRISDIIRDGWKETKKKYYALVESPPKTKSGTINSWLKEDSRQKVSSVGERENGKFAVTNYNVVKQVGNYTLLDVNTETGRKNQIRVHLSEMGCPIVGDRRYGASDEFIRRIRLHAYSLAFIHPITGEKIILESPMPGGFLTIKQQDEKYKKVF
ncbi:MAG: RluA family pseudouridine synthase [Bacteroidales bacterium]